MRPEIAQKLETLPAAPGVYIMKDAQGQIFYIGKAKSLRDRVRSYFSGADTRAFVALLDELLVDLEVILTHSEKEALLVEDQLVKRHKPRFNVNLKDDKRYLCLRLDVQAKVPRIDVVRRFAKDGARYFGPYTSAASVREALRIINRHFQLRTCSDQMLASRTRPCLQYQIKRCPGPCVFDVAQEYRQNVENVIAFLSGRESELVERLRARMKEQSTALNFEAAALLRDQIAAIERSLERQRMVSSDFADRDVVGLYREGPAIEIHVMRTRGGRLVDAQRYSLEGLEVPSGDILADFAARYYGSEEIPDEILFPLEMEWTEPLAELLSEKRGKAVQVRAPQRGDKRRLIELAQKNAEQAFKDKQRERGAAKSAVERLQRALKLSRPPTAIECFDISHLSGEAIVASVVRFEAGVPRKELYRHYKIRSTSGQDDFQSMYEVLSRRARRGLEDGDLPDLLVIDGGRGQLNAARAALDDHGIANLDVVGLAKSRPLAEGWEEEPAREAAPGREAPPGREAEPRRGAAPHEEEAAARYSPERVFVLGQKNPIVLGQNSAELFLLTRARDEAHRFAITFHRKVRRKSVTRSALDDLPGIGPKRRRALLSTFGSLEALRRADRDAIAAVIGAKNAERLLAALHGSSVIAATEATGAAAAMDEDTLAIATAEGFEDGAEEDPAEEDGAQEGPGEMPPTAAGEMKAELGKHEG